MFCDPQIGYTTKLAKQNLLVQINSNAMHIMATLQPTGLVDKT